MNQSFPDVWREVRQELAWPGGPVGEAGVEVLVAGVQYGLRRQQVTSFPTREHHGVWGRIHILRPQVSACKGYQSSISRGELG